MSIKILSAANSRRRFIKLITLGLAGRLLMGTFEKAKIEKPNYFEDVSDSDFEQINSYCIDFNWGEGGSNAFAPPGLWASADPKQHIQWYHDLGCNVVQTFAVSCNGYAWYKNGFVPEQPGLKYDFLTDMVKIGHEKGMKVFGYFCVGANTKWGLEQRHLSYGIPSSPHIPLTTQYLDYLSSSIEDALHKTEMDGFMIDWLWNPVAPDKPLRWLTCERQMFEELMEVSFPGKEKIQPFVDMEFRRKAINRCWCRIREVAKRVNPHCIIWLSCNNMFREDIQQAKVFKDVDWLMNEAGGIDEITAVESMVGRETRLLTCLARWNGADPAMTIQLASSAGIGLYGFTKPAPNSLPAPVNWYLSQPVDILEGDDKNIAVMSRVYNNLPILTNKNK